MIHVTYHALDRITKRTSLDATLAHEAYTVGLPLDTMPLPTRDYIAKRLVRYHRALYRLYLDSIWVYRANTFKDTKDTLPLALITVLPLPPYLRLTPCNKGNSL